MRLLNTLSLHERSRNAFCNATKVRLTAPAEANGPKYTPGLSRAPRNLVELREIVAGGQMNERKRLVVAQQHVVARHQALDQVAFEQQRFGLGRGADNLERCGLGDHAADAVRQSGRVRVVLHPAFQIARLADIERVAFTVEHAVDAGVDGTLRSAARKTATPCAMPPCG